MAKIKKNKGKAKPSKTEELLENPNALAERINKTEEFIEKNRKWVFGIGGAIILIVGLFFIFRYYVNNRNHTAQSEMFQAVYYFEADSLQLALNGDGNNYGFLEIIDDYPLTDAANLANYYAGISFLKLEQHEDAVEHLKKFSSDDFVVQARAFALIGDAYMEMENYDQAVKFYDRAADYKPNQYFTPDYLMKEALAYELMGDLESAIDSYQEIVDEFYEADQLQEAKKQLARLKSLAANQ